MRTSRDSSKWRFTFKGWLKKYWHDPVWSNVISFIIISIIIFLWRKMTQFLDEVELDMSNIFAQDGILFKRQSLSNLSIVLILLYILVSGSIILNFIIRRRWLGKTDKLYSSGSGFKVKGTWSMSLDIGALVNLENADFWWEQKTKVERRIVSKNKAQFCILHDVDFENISQEQLANLSYSSNEIIADDNYQNNIPAGTVVAYKTRSGRYGVMRIDVYGYNLEVTYKTFKSETD